MRGKQKAERLLLGTSACELDLVLVLDQVCDSTAAGSQVGFGSPMHLSCAPFLDRISTYGLLGTSVRAESRQVFWYGSMMTTELILLFSTNHPEKVLIFDWIVVAMRRKGVKIGFFFDVIG